MLFCLLVIVISTSSFAENTKISDENVPFLYEARADIKAPKHKLAKLISSDYRNAKDEFTRHDLFQQIDPVLDKRLTEANKIKQVLLCIGGRLDNYDFDKKSFPTGFGPTTFIPFKNGYAVTFTNPENIQYISVPIESAKKLSNELRRSRKTVFNVYGEITGTKEADLDWRTKKALQVKITKIEAHLKSGTKIGVKTL